jgi:hypothetical protein
VGVRIRFSTADLPLTVELRNIIGLASSTKLERSYFVAELMRATFSWGCYQMEVYISRFSRIECEDPAS